MTAAPLRLALLANWRAASAVRKALDTCKADLDARLKAVLTPEQWEKLQILMQPPSSTN